MQVIQLPGTARVQRVRFDGVIYRRYPQSRHSSSRGYFRCGPGCRIKKGRGYLHRDVWAFHNGAIPDGHEIDHADGDKGNNDVGNLVLLTVEQHKEKHREEGRQRTKRRMVEHPEQVEAMLRKAAEWHGSPEGIEWHRQHGRDVAANQPDVRLVCEQCGGVYATKPNRRSVSRFCSNNCKATARRRSGVDDVDRSCACCGEVFRVGRYSRVVCCSRACGQRRSAATRKARVQPDGG